MNASVSIIISDDHGKVISIFQGRRVKIEDGHAMRAYEEAFRDTLDRNPISGHRSEPSTHHRE